MFAIPAVLHPTVSLPAEELEAFCRKWQIARLELFGSALRPDFAPGSDLDFLYTLAPDSTVGLWDLPRMKGELAAIVGREIDLVSRAGVERSENWIRRPAILGSAIRIYERTA